METKYIDLLFLELSQVTQATTKKEAMLKAHITELCAEVSELHDLLTSARAIVARRGEDTAWGRFDERLRQAGIGNITPKTFRVLEGDETP